ncbi:MAG: hypothetical protein ACYC6Y_18440 [Thermoguttaceae bacterium]
MLSYLLYVGATLYLGILTSISPCPLATNIAAVSYVGRKVENSSALIHACRETIGANFTPRAGPNRPPDSCAPPAVIFYLG